MINEKKSDKIKLSHKGEVYIMSKGRTSARARKRVQQHRVSIILISCVLVLLAGVLGINSMSLRAKNREYQAQEKELEMQIQEQEAKKDELADLEEYVGTDEYIAEIAKDTLGLVYEGEILFEAEP